VNPTKRIKFSK